MTKMRTLLVRKTIPQCEAGMGVWRPLWDAPTAGNMTGAKDARVVREPDERLR